MKGFRVEGQKLGAAQTETVAHQGECRHFGHATKLHSFKRHWRGSPVRGVHLVTVGTFETKVRPSRGFRVYTMHGTVPPLAPLVCFPRDPSCGVGGGVFTWVVQPPLAPLLCGVGCGFQVVLLRRPWTLSFWWHCPRHPFKQKPWRQTN